MVASCLPYSRHTKKKMDLMIVIAALSVLFQQTQGYDFRTCRSYFNRGLTNGDQFRFNCPGYQWSNIHTSHAYTNNLKVAYIDFPPYIYSDGSPTAPRGIWVDFLKDLIDRVCPPGKRTISWERQSFTTIEELQNHCKAVAYRCHFSLPTTGLPSSDTVNDVEWAITFPESNAVLLRVVGEEWRPSLKKFSDSIANTWPLFVLCLIGAFISGFVMWALDTWFNVEHFPRSYYNGIYQAFWWSFVSMTTVGYGDKAPLSFAARFFSIFWILIGISLIGILTSVLSNALSSGLEIAPMEYRGNKIATLGKSTLVTGVIIAYGGTPLIAKDEIEIEEWLARGLIDGFAMDEYNLQYYWKKRWSKLVENGVKFKVESVTPYAKSFGISVYAVSQSAETYRNQISYSTQPWDECIEEYMKKNAELSSEMLEKYLASELDKLDNSILAPVETVPLKLFDPDSEYFQQLMSISGGIIIGILVLGIIYEYFRRTFFKPGGPKPKMKGLGVNAGYNGSGDTTNDDDRLSKEEKNVQDLVERALKSSDEKIQETQRTVHNEIMEMSRAIRREMVELKRRNHKDYGL